MVLVAEDVLNENEAHDEYPALRKAAAYSSLTRSTGSRAVVGVASICIKPGSVYTGMFQPTGELIKSHAFQPARS